MKTLLTLALLIGSIAAHAQNYSITSHGIAGGGGTNSGGQYAVTDLAYAGWADVVGSPTMSGNEQFLQFAASTGRVFFRLRKL